MPSLTYYVDHSSRPCSNGSTYAANLRRYHHFVASNRFTLGSRLTLTSRAGRRVSVVVADRIGHGTDVDADAGTFRALAGPRYRLIGRLTVRVHLASGRRQ
ncbi:MAG: hypothetical protein ACRYFS_24565 [Janthinobacterium lividum]